MISEQTYTELTIDEKAEILWRKGTFIAEIIEYRKQKVCIYELNEFFVGVFYNVRNNSIDKIEILNTGKQEWQKRIFLN